MWDTWICGRALWGKEEMCVRDGLQLKGAAVFAESMPGAVASGLGKVRYLTSWVGGGLSKKAQKYKRIVDTREHRETHPKPKLNACA